MPRAFLITHKRYFPQEYPKTRENSPECQVKTAEFFVPSVENRLPTQNAGRPIIHQEDRPLELTTARDSARGVFRKSLRVLGSGNEAELGSCTSSFCEASSDEFYNLTKLAEVSLAAAAGQLFYGRNLENDVKYEKWPEQEYPEDLSQDISNFPALESKPLEVHACPECGKKYSTSSNLARHRQTHRSLADKKARTCPHCDKIYVSMPAFSMHVRTHNQGCKCSYCGKCFSRPWLLQGHIRTHTGEKPFKCTICAKAFADKSNLRAHVQTHSTMKPHICIRCGKAFALKSYLYKHEESSCMKSHCGNDKRNFGQTKRSWCPSRLKEKSSEKAILSIPTPVISVAIRV